MTVKETQVVDAQPQAAKAGTLPSALRMLRDRADRHLIARLRVVFDHVDDTFFDLADRAENHRQQTHYFDAMRLIRVERKAIESRFQGAVSRAFDALMTATPSAAPVDSSSVDDGFELVGNDELEEIIALDTMVSKADEQHGKELQLLIKRLETLSAEPVTSQSNPLGPDLICDAFFRTIEGLDIGIRSKLVLLKLFDRHVVASLGDFLQQCNQLLEELGILPGLQLKKATSESVRAANNAGSSSSAAETRSQVDAGVGHDYRHDHVRGADNNTKKAAGAKSDSHGASQPHDYGRLVTQLNSVLSRFKGVGAVEQSAPEENYAELDDVLNAVTSLQVNSLLGSIAPDLSVVDALKQQVNNEQGAQMRSSEQAVVNLVDSMFSRVRSENGFSAALEPEMFNLEMAIMKVALKDPSFFDKERHPARRLLNEVGNAAIGFGGDDLLTEDPLYQKIHEVLDQLQNVAADHATLTRLLTDFIGFVEKERRRVVTKEQRLLEEESAKARLNFSHQAVNALLDERVIGMELPQITVSFIEQAWGKVMFLAYLREGESSDAWRAASQILDEVIDLSVLRSEALPVRRALQLLKSIRQKLEEVALDPYQTEHLIRGMEQLMQASVEGNSDDLKRVKVEALYPSIPGEPEQEESALDDQNLNEASLHDIESIRRGAWVELQMDGNVTQRARFAGTVGPADKLIFVNRKGAKVAEGSRRRLAVELKNERLVILDNSPLFDRALNGIVTDVRERKIPAV